MGWLSRLKGLGAIEPKAIHVQLYSLKGLELAMHKLGHTTGMGKDMVRFIKKAALDSWEKHMLTQQGSAAPTQQQSGPTQVGEEVVVGNVSSECGGCTVHECLIIYATHKLMLMCCTL